MGKEDMAAQPRPYMANRPYGYQQPMYNQYQYESYEPGRPLCTPYGQQPGPGYGGYGDYGYGAAQYPPAYANYGGAVAGNGYGGAYGMEPAQRQGDGGRMAMAGLGGLALGAGAVFAADHAGDIAHFAEEAVEDMGDFARDIF